MARITVSLFFLIFLFTSNATYCQSFVKVLNTNEDECLNFSIENPYGGYIVTLSKGTYSASDRGRISERDILLKLDALGNDLDSLVIDDSGILKFLLCGLVKLQNENEFIAWGANYISPNLLDPVSIRIIRLTYDLEIEHDTTLFSSHNNYIYPGEILVNSHDHLVMAGTITPTDYSSYTSFCKEMTIDGESISEKIYDSFQPHQHIVELPAHHHYNLIDFNRIVEIDSAFNFVQTLYVVPTALYEFTIFNLMTSKNINDSSYLVEGNEAALGGTLNGTWGLFNNQYWTNVYYFGSFDTTDNMAGMDFINTDHIYSGLSHFPENSTDFEMVDNQMLLYSTQLPGSTNWYIRYGGVGFIRSGFPLATSDNGCLWMGNYWDWHNKTAHEYDAILIKVDENGSILTQLPEIISNHLSIILSPNPSDEIHLNTTIEKYSFQLRNILGQDVISLNCLDGNKIIPTSRIPSGIYYYAITSGNNIVETGKWIKK
jgi:hypothetical protein